MRMVQFDYNPILSITSVCHVIHYIKIHATDDETLLGFMVKYVGKYVTLSGVRNLVFVGR